ncbi:MAG: 23S rRNA (uracil(1939)-C(5))-methyltransferase RlmD [Eubacteriales bacterium]|nr:23S rRNA (uracil(1939)-C(5))-methyltransferase RlmD [Eubacteriales bacterium]
MKKNDIIRLQIVDMTSDGSGVGRADDGTVVFVPDTALNDVCDVRILKVKKNLSFGKIENIITPSADRVDPVCPVSTRCGGCVYRHLHYSAELRVKQKKVYDAVVIIGKVDGGKVKEIIGADDRTDRYRNKAQIPVSLNKNGEVELGFYSRHSHRIAPCDDCLLSPLIFTQLSAMFKDFLSKYPYLVYDEENHSGKIRHLYLRIGESTGEVMLCVVVNGKSFDHQDEFFSSIKEEFPQVKSAVINVNTAKTNVILGEKNIVVYGKESITDILCDLKFELSPLAFYQVNRVQAQRLYEKAREYAQLTGDEVLIDLYCGTGTIGLSMAKDCKELIGVEIIDKAIENAKKNADNNNINNASFICGDATVAADKLKKEGIKPDVVVVDPPRKGLTEELIHTIVQMKPERVVYVSCDPATLARDLKLFEELNYSVKEITPVDLFPRTAHVESVVMMSKKPSP